MSDVHDEIERTSAALDLVIDGMTEQLSKLKAGLTELRHRQPIPSVKDYIFQGAGSLPINLSQLFGDKKDLIVIHNMGTTCSYCTMWADGFNGMLAHLEDRAAFVMISPDSPEEQHAFATQRGWTFTLCSAKETSFFQDMGFVSDQGSPLPGVSTFRRQDNGEIKRVAKAKFGPGDDFCPSWHLFDLLENGSDGWQPKLSYNKD